MSLPRRFAGLPLDYDTLLASESRRFRDALAGCDPSAPVPSCADWSATDLAWHLTYMQWFWASMIDALVSGPAEDLLLWLWRRGPAPHEHPGVDVVGDRAVYDAAHALVAPIR